jgi:NAD+ synthase
MKQRARKLVEYFHAERMNYAVLGTANRLEHELGFFVRGGDGLADLKPIAHLYKTQVISLAEYLGVPDEIVALSPTTDTFSLPQTQEEFYFGLPHADLDLLLHAQTQGIAPTDVGGVVGLRPEQVERAYRDIESKRRTAARASMDALLVEPVPLPSIGQ